MQTRQTKLQLVLALALAPLLARCHPSASTDNAVAAGPASQPISLAADTVPLSRRAAQLRVQVDSALAQGSNLDPRLVYRIASVSDRMAVSRLPFTWSKDSYDVGARVRQIQALAARITAEVQRDLEPDSIRPDLMGLRTEIDRLRTELAAGGGLAPPSLDSLMSEYPRQHTVAVPASAGHVE